MKEKKADRFFLIIVFILLFTGVAVFVSASLGILNRNTDLFLSVLFSQLVLGLGLGLIGMYFCYKINYKFWRKYSFLIFLGSILLTAAVFIPSLGWSHGGAERWIQLGPVSFQPVEFLKFGFVIYFAAWLSWVKDRARDFRFGILPFGIMLAIIAVILLKQPDTKSFILIAITGMAMLFVSSVPIKYILGARDLGILYAVSSGKSQNFYQSGARRERIFLSDSAVADRTRVRRNFRPGIRPKRAKIQLSSRTARGLHFCRFRRRIRFCRGFGRHIPLYAFCHARVPHRQPDPRSFQWTFGLRNCYTHYSAVIYAYRFGDRSPAAHWGAARVYEPGRHFTYGVYDGDRHRAQYF